MMRAFITGIFCLLLASCANYKYVGTTSITVKGMQITPHANWNKAPKAPGNNVEVWTADGHQLNELILIGEIQSGTTLFKASNKELPMPKYKTGMLPNDMEDLVTTSLKNLFGGDLNIKTSNLRPIQVSDQTGFRFNLNYFTQNGLAKRGDVVVLEKNNKLYSMIFIGTKIHYYERLAAEFEMMVMSLVV